MENFSQIPGISVGDRIRNEDLNHSISLVTGMEYDQERAMGKQYSTHGWGIITIRPDIDNWNRSFLYTENEDEDLGFYPIQGALLEPVNYSLESDWSPIKTPFDSGLGDIINDVSVAAGTGALGGVFTSKLYWRESGYVKISPKFRIYEDVSSGGSNVLHAARGLLRYIAPMRRFQSATITGLLNSLRDKANGLHQASLADPENLTWEEALRTFGKEAIENYFSGFTDLFTPKASPPPVIVDIGRIFGRGNMVVTNVNFEFSQEFTEAGPIYVDVTLDLMSRTIVGNEVNIHTGGGDDIGILSTGYGINQTQIKVNDGYENFYQEGVDGRFVG